MTRCPPGACRYCDDLRESRAALWEGLSYIGVALLLLLIAAVLVWWRC